MTWATATMGRTKGSEAARLSQSHKSVLSSDRSLQPRLREAGIASNRGSARGEYVPGLVHTARHTTRVCTPEVGEVTLEPAAEGGTDDWGEVVTR